jgi:hypothetical protein
VKRRFCDTRLGQLHFVEAGALARTVLDYVEGSP